MRKGREKMERDVLGYANGKGTWFIVFILMLMATITVGYALLHFFPDLTHWLKEGVDPDKIIWLTEVGK